MKNRVVSPISIFSQDKFIWDMLVNTDKWVRACPGDTLLVEQIDEFKWHWVYDPYSLSAKMPNAASLLHWLLDQYDKFIVELAESNASSSRRSFRRWLLKNIKPSYFDSVLDSCLKSRNPETEEVVTALLIVHFYEQRTT